jgi:hypothetical protein
MPINAPNWDVADAVDYHPYVFLQKHYEKLYAKSGARGRQVVETYLLTGAGRKPYSGVLMELSNLLGQQLSIR